MATQDQYIRTALRVPADLHEAIHESAAARNRTFNAELIARLQASFEENATLSFAIQQAIDDEMEETGCSAVDALTRLVLAGQTQGGTVLNIRVAPGTTAKDVRDAINAALKLVPPDSSVIFDREAKG
jgi:hypothetical protein